ncbi:hypothetical protein Fmac_026539 [Flemingia macrophylla]|uniref:Uncharacterized protein n=1 Tax=Flemingia macrophylla TaxID=520843 RepID=A0ABD1LGV8_9FABA
MEKINGRFEWLPLAFTKSVSSELDLSSQTTQGKHQIILSRLMHFLSRQISHKAWLVFDRDNSILKISQSQRRESRTLHFKDAWLVFDRDNSILKISQSQRRESRTPHFKDVMEMTSWLVPRSEVTSGSAYWTIFGASLQGLVS